MNFSRFSYYSKVYSLLLPSVIPYTTILGMITGATYTSSTNSPFDFFTNVIGYTTIGMITGVTYPISFPLFGIYVLYKHQTSLSNTQPHK